MTHFHSPEPWKNSSENYADIEDAQGFYCASAIDNTTAERIVACVNACAGVETHDLKEVIELGKASLTQRQGLEKLI